VIEIDAALRDLLRKRGVTQAWLAEQSGVPPETVNRIVTGATKNPGVYTLARLLRPLGATVGSLMGEKSFEFTAERRQELQQFVDWGEGLLKATEPEAPELQPPNASAVTLGRRPPQRVARHGRATPVSATDWRESFGDRREDREVEIPERFAERGATLVFRAEGESMTGESIADGDLLYVLEEPDARHARGRIVVCVVSGSPYVKRLEVTAGRIRLLSANERFSPMIVNEDQVEWSLVGIVVGWSHDAR
jgi:SOS-response transcriptional repressor LexA